MNGQTFWGSPGSNPYNNYDKSGFSDRAQVMIKADDRQSHELSDDGRTRLLVQLRATPKPNLQLLTYRLPALKALADTVSELLSTTVVSVRSLRPVAICSSRALPTTRAWSCCTTSAPTTAKLRLKVA